MIRSSVTDQAVKGGGEVWADEGPAVTEPAGDPPPVADEIDYRWIANYQRAEIRALEAKVRRLERRLIPGSRSADRWRELGSLASERRVGQVRPPVKISRGRYYTRPEKS